MAVSLLVPDLKEEGTAYKYRKTLARELVMKCKDPAEFVELIDDELKRETSRVRREALVHLKQRAIEVFALDEGH